MIMTYVQKIWRKTAAAAATNSLTNLVEVDVDGSSLVDSTRGSSEDTDDSNDNAGVNNNAGGGRADTQSADTAIHGTTSAETVMFPPSKMPDLLAYKKEHGSSMNSLINLVVRQMSMAAVWMTVRPAPVKKLPTAVPVLLLATAVTMPVSTTMTVAMALVPTPVNAVIV